MTSPLALPAVYHATVSQSSRVLPTVLLTKDTTAGTSGSNTKRSPAAHLQPDCQTLPGSCPSLYSSPQPPTCKESTRSISQHSCQHLIFYVKLYLTIILSYISLKSIFLLLYQPYRFFLGDCLNLWPFTSRMFVCVLLTFKSFLFLDILDTGPFFPISSKHYI